MYKLKYMKKGEIHFIDEPYRTYDSTKLKKKGDDSTFDKLTEDIAKMELGNRVPPLSK